MYYETVSCFYRENYKTKPFLLNALNLGIQSNVIVKTLWQRLESEFGKSKARCYDDVFKALMKNLILD
jgi:hypothetical protein